MGYIHIDNASRRFGCFGDARSFSIDLGRFGVDLPRSVSIWPRSGSTLLDLRSIWVDLASIWPRSGVDLARSGSIFDRFGVDFRSAGSFDATFDDKCEKRVSYCKYLYETHVGRIAESLQNARKSFRARHATPMSKKVLRRALRNHSGTPWAPPEDPERIPRGRPKRAQSAPESLWGRPQGIPRHPGMCQ